MKKRILGFSFMGLLILIDQITKIMAENALQSKPDIPLISGVFELSYVQNTGGAFSLFDGQVKIFAVLTSILCIALIYFYLKIPTTKEYAVYRFLAVLLTAGGIGNVIDRIFRGYVVDFLYFKLINFPVFNVADCYVTISLVVLLLYVLFTKDDRLERLFEKKPGNSKTTTEE